ncbi:hypothetical protein Ddc_02542 [Ditylenchus destructor]|nr:hypothetical protein Ddc_02542 [Ditylenchus destructor]
MIPISDSDQSTSKFTDAEKSSQRMDTSPVFDSHNWLPNSTQRNTDEKEDDIILHHDDTDSSCSDDDDDSGWGSLSEEDGASEMQQRISNLIEIQGICHIDLLGVQFKITHNEETNDFFVDLVQSEGCLQSVLQVIFRFPSQQNGLMEMFASSYDHWSKQGRVVHCDHQAVTKPSKSKFGTSKSSVSASVLPFQHHWHLQIHVYEQYYTINLNGREVERLSHRLPFRRIHKPRFAAKPSTECEVSCRAAPTALNSDLSSLFNSQT